MPPLIDDFENRMIARDLVAKAFAALTEREEDILASRVLYHATFQQLGDDYSVSNSRIMQIEAKALRKCRKRLRIPVYGGSVTHPSWRRTTCDT